MKLKLVILLVIILSLTQIVFSQSISFFNPNTIGAGARARGMGGAFIGVADDATAASWNPAGLVRLETAEASVVGLFESYTPETDVPDFDADPYKSSHFGLNFISVAIPLSLGERNLVAAVAYQKVTDAYSKYDGDNALQETTGGINAITPSIGIQLTNSISLGASVNILTGAENLSYEDKTGYYQSYDYTTDLSGTNFSIGGLFDFNQFRLGVVFKTPFGLKIEDSDRSWDLTFNIPQMLGFGASFAPTEQLTIAADYEMRKYSDAEYEANETGETMSADWLDVNQVRVGAEYLLMTGENVLPLRVGFATTPLPFEDDNGDQLVGSNITAGIGIIMGAINLDLGMEYNSYSYEFTGGGETYNYSDNYLRFIISGVFHFGQ
ncbi:hypothetical protein H8E88_14590 [candidate division KSB1 bacterium]|nr:hypothetical protein [candidate division KSB1 bacterium]MBL7093183.1 hypothetical protein [candidate division KSB1 bacterium]